MGRLMAFDIGAKRTGIAVTDDLQMIASPLQTVSAAALHQFVRDYSARYDISGFVLGDPMDLQGNHAESKRLVDNFKSFLQKNFKDIPVHMVDERYTSKMAQQSLVEMGMKKSRRRQKGALDAVAAAIILQSFLDSK